MKLGLGLYRDSLTSSNFKFARQAGATHLVVHLVDYFKGANPALSRGDDVNGWGSTDRANRLWDLDELLTIKKEIESHGLVWEAIENFDPAHWSDVLLDGPNRDAQLEDLKQTIRTVGRAGISTIGYNFSIAGVWGWNRGPVGRGDAVSVYFDEREVDLDVPIPDGMVWNMRYTDGDPDNPPIQVSDEELWARLEHFLKTLLPVAEEEGVRLAAHPDDPPVTNLRGTSRLVNQPSKYQRLIDLAPSPSNGLEFCMGTVQEMSEGSALEALDTYSKQDRIFYIHFRNVKGKVPNYQEVFVDEGDIDMIEAVNILKRNGYDGVLIPDHTPEMSCEAPWHAGKAFAMGYMRALIQAAEH